jgi:hypothetical protein
VKQIDSGHIIRRGRDLPRRKKWGSGVVLFLTARGLDEGKRVEEKRGGRERKRERGGAREREKEGKGPMRLDRN